MNRGYTTLEQSKKLLELGLNPETADMHYTNMCPKGVMYSDDFREGLLPYNVAVKYNQNNIDFLRGSEYKGVIAWEILPCWSLQDLLDLIPNYTIVQNPLTAKIVIWSSGNNSGEHDLIVEAAFEMVVRLLEQGLIMLAYMDDIKPNAKPKDLIKED